MHSRHGCCRQTFRSYTGRLLVLERRGALSLYPHDYFHNPKEALIGLQDGMVLFAHTCGGKDDGQRQFPFFITFGEGTICAWLHGLANA